MGPTTLLLTTRKRFGSGLKLLCFHSGFFQDKHVKVSLFLQEGIQTPAGRIILPGPLTSSSCVTPGEVVIFGENGGFTHKEKVVI